MARETALAQDSASVALGLECLQICHDIRDLIRIEPELRHRRMVDNNAFRQEFEMQCAERGRDGEWATTDLVDGMANAHECQAPLGCRRLGENWTACQ